MMRVFLRVVLNKKPKLLIGFPSHYRRTVSCLDVSRSQKNLKFDLAYFDPHQKIGQIVNLKQTIEKCVDMSLKKDKKEAQELEVIRQQQYDKQGGLGPGWCR